MYVLQEFMVEEPILSEFKAKCLMFKNLENNIDDIQTSEIVGPIELFTGKSVISQLIGKQIFHLKVTVCAYQMMQFSFRSFKTCIES